MRVEYFQLESQGPIGPCDYEATKKENLKKHVQSLHEGKYNFLGDYVIIRQVKKQK